VCGECSFVVGLQKTPQDPNFVACPLWIKVKEVRPKVNNNSFKGGLTFMK